MSPALLEKPFSQARWELEGLHLFHLPRQRFSRLEEPKPTYIIGTRGTGKTTLLKSLNWELRLTNNSLRDQLRALTGSTDLFVGRYVGVYFKLPRAQLSIFDDYVGPEHPLYTNLFALHIALNWIDLLVDATAGLARHDIISLTSSDELRIATAVHQRYSDYELVDRYFGPRESRTLGELSHATRRLREHLERDLQTGITPEEIASRIPVGQLGEIASFVASQLLTVYGAEEDGWTFRVCMDEGEVLTPSQQRAINSMVRVAERPVLPLLAATSLPEPLHETSGRMKVTNADVNLLWLTDWPDSEFADFVQGVSAVRMRAATGDPSLEVDLASIVGTWHVNEILEDVLTGSANAWGQQLLATARSNRDERYFGDLDNDAPPIYQTYLVEALELDVPDANSTRWEQRKQQSAEIRKRIVAAYLSVCQRVGATPRYAGRDMILQLCDGCVRDFLWQMHEIYLEADVSPASFLTTHVSVFKQDRALRRAAENKLSRLGNYVFAETSTMTRLVDGLGEITAALQRPPESRMRDGYSAHLRSSERGAFRTPTGSRLEDDAVLLELVQEAVDANYLTWCGTQSNPVRFRVHTSLAPHFGFSYRGAYSDTTIEIHELRALLAQDESDHRKAVNEIVNRLTEERRASSESTLPLFQDLEES